jgi:MFS family permease
LLDSLPPEKRGGGMMLTAVLPQVPSLFMPPVGGYLLDHLGLLGMRLSFVISGIISVTVALLRMRALQETVTAKPESRGKLAREILQSYFFWRGLFSLPPFIAYVTFLGFLKSFAGIALQTFGVLYATDVLRLDSTSWGVIQSASIAVGMFFGFVLMPVIDKTPRVSALFAGLLLMALGYFIVGIWGDVVALVTAVILSGVGFEVTMSTRRALVGDYIMPENRGKVMGTTLALEYLGSIIGGVAVAYLYTLSPRLAFVFSGAVLILAAAPLVRGVIQTR